MEASIRYIRSLTGELSPPVLYDLGFAPAVVWLARQIHDQQGIEVELRQHPIAWPPVMTARSCYSSFCETC